MKDAVNQFLAFVFQFVVHNSLQFLNGNRRSGREAGDKVDERKSRPAPCWKSKLSEVSKRSRAPFFHPLGSPRRRAGIITTVHRADQPSPGSSFLERVHVLSDGIPDLLVENHYGGQASEHEDQPDDQVHEPRCSGDQVFEPSSPTTTVILPSDSVEFGLQAGGFAFGLFFDEPSLDGLLKLRVKTDRNKAVPRVFLDPSLQIDRSRFESRLQLRGGEFSDRVFSLDRLVLNDPEVSDRRGRGKLGSRLSLGVLTRSERNSRIERLGSGRGRIAIRSW